MRGFRRHVGYAALFCALSLPPIFAEPSAFELQSGATKRDLQALKDVADFTQSTIVDFQDKISNIEQSIEGLKTLYEGMIESYRKDSLSLKSQSNQIANMQNQIDSIQSSQKSKSADVEALMLQIESNKKNIMQLNQKIDKLSEAFLKANEEIVKQIEVLSRQTLSLQSSIQSLRNKPVKPVAMPKEPPRDKYGFSSKSKQEILKEAKRLFAEKSFDDSKAHFEYLLENKHEVAESNYYLGEIYYSLKEYRDALPYYKTSASLDSGAKYMPVLLWHTAWSFKYLKDAENYKKSLQTLVALFPTSDQGVKAREILNKQ